jgi:hypothetical protein
VEAVAAVAADGAIRAEVGRVPKPTRWPPSNKAEQIFQPPHVEAAARQELGNVAQVDEGAARRLLLRLRSPRIAASSWT